MEIFHVYSIFLYYAIIEILIADKIQRKKYMNPNETNMNNLDTVSADTSNSNTFTTHTHILEDGTVVTHTHNNSHNHSHPHHHENTKAVLNRMSRAIGHMESIKRMVEDGRDCSEVLIQIAAVRSAINNIGKIILEDHINHCIVDAVETGDKKALEDLNEAIEKFVK